MSHQNRLGFYFDVGWTKGTKQITTFTNCDGKLLTSSKIMAKSTRPHSKLHVSNSARQEKLIPNLVPSKTTR
jgi:hypothetical protein